MRKRAMPDFGLYVIIHNKHRRNQEHSAKINAIQ